MFGEVLVTCEKLKWTIANGAKVLADEPREAGTLMMMKSVRVEYRPLGVIGAIVPWNYPFHNVLNPVIAALFAGNGIVIKVSEYASWSIRYYGRMINECLKAAGAPTDLVQFVTGYGATGNALVTCKNVDKIIFVGSPGVGVMVQKAAAANLTPVVLELGGKDPFVVCEDADLSKVVQIACRGVFQNMGQNCAGPERFFVYEGAYDKFCTGVTAVVKQCKQGPTLGEGAESVDCGAITMGPVQIKHYQKLVDDAVSKGAKILAGGVTPGKDSIGSFYPPTILADVPSNALIAQEEIFGPIMCIFKVPGDSDDKAVEMANDCPFGLSSCAFSADAARASKLAGRLRAGMSAVNDLEGTAHAPPRTICAFVNTTLDTSQAPLTCHSRCRSAAEVQADTIDLRGPRAFVGCALHGLSPRTGFRSHSSKLPSLVHSSIPAPKGVGLCLQAALFR
jgi:acyl-CoA reductase-like NAD-dependent aldehyde dehydrogenase